MRNHTVILAGPAGVGKTELAKRYANALDLDCASFFWISDCGKQQNGNGQSDGAYGSSPNRKPNPDWPHNYLEAINQNRSKYDYILIFTRLEKQNFANLDYKFIFPAKEAVPETEQRLAARGEPWARLVYADYDKHLEYARTFGKPINFIKPGQTLETYLLENQHKYPPLVKK